MHIHLLGIGGTFMAGLALLARQLGHTVTGSDHAIYPPMSQQLAAQQITYFEGYDAAHLSPAPDCVIIGNAMTRGNPEVEEVLNRRLFYCSGPQWLFDHVLRDRWVLAVSGTHGKTTTTSILTWILHHAGLAPGYLIGGIPENFGVSADLGNSAFFVIEADEYDSAFFDKRSKFLHYRPNTLIINNIEYDHADIFKDLAAIQQQFYYLVRALPSQGLIVHAQQSSIETVLQRECWTPRETFGDSHAQWQADTIEDNGCRFQVKYNNKSVGDVNWSIFGQHNVNNALAAIAAARHAGVPVALACEALATFQNVKRRLECRGIVQNIHVYDDFAHHPTAIAVTLAALRAQIGQQRLIAVLEPRSNSMKQGVFRDSLAESLQLADQVIVYQPPQLSWSLAESLARLPQVYLFQNTALLLNHLLSEVKPHDHVLIMSNGHFEQLHDRLLQGLKQQA
ncbi:UDP-N-acetylmuramate:L-alanyl-gamma-D-glutamyl-meso-diaminopimelate ligase [Thioflexithrix psekupsensis]|uniref:UDP-N-acetylmuramate--L-alanyl-gamma-D-glutamyl-meso-2,6-diaminoheptandioate ligase n=1 Tax=Thioflexithrix psekupsensis TaxID=1570016 RepID=A0A251X9N0_9GAMM|nr:UDP-N-acetylmuramate:L-alanyl-gamma-D-glutamyl-meso-diaminopimelate ligase [Thioflexithrix psekupsensis]OUD14383.1 UDP-N-acetylmuramate:L-alanyl-gamma-D-glutamyl-meso-diaminopimelate ligase [Thioflexithrix psekupsensis]